MPAPKNKSFPKLNEIPRNLWFVSLTSFFMDISSEMVLNILPLFMQNVLKVPFLTIGIIEGIAEATASVLKVFSGWLSDKLGTRKWLAVLGYGVSALVKPFFYIANSTAAVAGIRWMDRFGKGIRTAPRDALVADSIEPEHRGFAFGLHRAADTAGAFLGILIAAFVVWKLQAAGQQLTDHTFRTIVLISIIPAFLAVLSLAFGAKDTTIRKVREGPKISFKGLGKNFLIFMVIVGLFDLGNSSDAFLVLRAQERGMNILNILIMLAIFNLVYTLVSTPAGALSDRIGRRTLIVAGWIVYALIYLGFALAKNATQIWMLYVAYGLYYGMAYGTAKAMVTDLVPSDLLGTAHGTYNAVLGILDFPASLIAGLLWSGAFGWKGFGPSAPFYFGATCAILAVILFLLWKPQKSQMPLEISQTDSSA
jgi:MFS family permease